MKTRYLILSIILLMIGGSGLTIPPTTNVAAKSTKSKQYKYNPGVPWEKETDHRYDIQPTHKNNVIYYQMKIKSSSPYYYIWKLAIYDWNDLGVINLKKAPKNYHGYSIKLGGNYNIKQGQNDLTAHNDVLTEIAQTSFYTEDSSKNKQLAFFYKAEANLNPILTNWGMQFQTIAAEHEMGHILGFDHDSSTVNGRHHIMNGTIHSNDLPLGKHEKRALKKMYR